MYVLVCSSENTNLRFRRKRRIFKSTLKSKELLLYCKKNYQYKFLLIKNDHITNELFDDPNPYRIQVFLA